MRNKLVRRIKRLLPCSAICRSNSPRHQTSVDVREEYANTFRTESYVEFWTRVLTYSNTQSSSCLSRESTISARLPSYRLFAEHLLDPDQPTVTRALSETRLKPTIHSLLCDYFAYTANASLLCSHILKDIDRIRVKYQSLKSVLQSVATDQVQSQSNLSLMMTQLAEFSNFSDPFAQSSSSSCLIREAQWQCSEMQKRLESSRNKGQAKLRLTARLKRGSTCLLVIATTSLVVIVFAHGFAFLMAMPGLFGLASMNTALERKLVKVTAQLDLAAKGMYIVNKDLETTSRLVARLNDELEYMRTTMKFWLKRKEDRIQPDGEMLRLLKNNQCNFSDQLDELEEHLYLCFMTINRARELVLKQIDPI